MKIKEEGKLDRFCMEIAWWLPKRIVYWCYIRIHAYATSYKYSDKHPDEVTWSMALKEWE